MQWFIDMIVAICNAYTDQAILDAKVIPSSTIILWHGRFVDIPDGWFYCNGDNGTPDLRDRFVVCAGPTYPRNQTGGSATHTHPAGADLTGGKNKSATASNLPPYHSIFYIMKA